ncbi:MAG: hypothetical protein ACK4IX_14545, partial [Candidatus Sericytochromatia bacterium]
DELINHRFIRSENFQQVDSLNYSIYQKLNTNLFIIAIEKLIKNEDVEKYKIMDTINVNNLNFSKLKINEINENKKIKISISCEGKILKIFTFNKSDSKVTTKMVNKNFIGKYTVSVEGDHANHGIEMYDYEINISENEISLHETNRELCSGRYIGKENNNTLELYYVQDDDERCVRGKAKYTIKKEGGQFYIQGVGGEGTYNEWTPLKKVTKFEN